MHDIEVWLIYLLLMVMSSYVCCTCRTSSIWRRAGSSSKDLSTRWATCYWPHVGCIRGTLGWNMSLPTLVACSRWLNGSNGQTQWLEWLHIFIFWHWVLFLTIQCMKYAENLAKKVSTKPYPVNLPRWMKHLKFFCRDHGWMLNLDHFSGQAVVWAVFHTLRYINHLIVWSRMHY